MLVERIHNDNNGFSILYKGKEILRQNKPPHPGPWNDGEMDQLIADLKHKFLNTIIIPEYLSKIKKHYNSCLSKPWVDKNGIPWNNGFISLQRLQSKYKLKQTLNEETIKLYDYNNNPHTFYVNSDEINQLLLDFATYLEALFEDYQDTRIAMRNAENENILISLYRTFIEKYPITD